MMTEVKKYLLKGNVSPCLLICSSTSGLQSVFRTMNGGERSLSSNKKRSKRTCGELVEYSSGILGNFPVKTEIMMENKCQIFSLVWASREQEN